MPMSEIDRKNYNKNYYQQNRVNTLQKACEPVNCPCCNRIVTKNRLNVHLKTKLCQKTQAEKKYITDRINTIHEFVKNNPIV
jgi:hypothetical protein